MSWIIKTLTSSIGKKVLTALTGLFLITFLVVHLIGNLQLFYSDNGYAFNTYTVFMTTNPVIKTTSYILYSSILFHAILGIYLVIKNKQARGTGYQVTNNQSAWTSRSMGVLGTIILVFIVVHMSDFWWEYKTEETFPVAKYTIVDGKAQYTDISKTPEGDAFLSSGLKMIEKFDENRNQVKIMKNLYDEVEEAYESIVIVLLYVFSMAAIAFHLSHGFASAFQTLGLNHNKYNGIINAIGTGYSILIPLGFALIPIVKFFS